MKVRTSAFRRLAILSLSALAFAACDDKEVTTPPTRPAVEVTITPSSANLTVGQTATFVAQVLNDTSLASAGGATFSSTNPAVASVNSTTGLVTALTPGTTTIIATTRFQSKQAAAIVTVTAAPPPPVVTITVAPTAATVPVGGTVQLVTAVSGSTNTAVTFTTSDASVATVSTTGLVTATQKNGTAVITASAAADPTKTAASIITVTGGIQPGQTAITINPPAATIEVGGTFTFVANVTGNTNTAKTFTSSDTTVATVNATTGVVTAKNKAGTTVITATSTADPTKQAFATLTVTKPAVTVTVSPTTVSLSPQGTTTITSTLTGSAADVAAGTSCVSSNTAVVTVVSSPTSCVVTAVASGTATVTVSSIADPTKSALVTVTVATVTQPSVSIQSVKNAAGADLASGATVSGDVVVTMNVTAGSQTNIQRLEVQLNGIQACQRIFTPPLAPTGGVATITCTINTAQLNASNGPVFPNGIYQLNAVAFDSNNTAVATAQFGTLNIQNTNIVTGTVTFVNTLDDGDNDPASATAVDAAGLTWNGGAATVSITPAIFQGSTVATASVSIDVACDGAFEATRSVTLSGGTGSVTFSEAAALGAGTPGIDDLSAPVVCFVVTNARDAGGATILLPAGGGRGNVITGGTAVGTTNANVGPGQNNFAVDNVQPVFVGGVMTFDPAQFDGLGTGVFLGAGTTISNTGAAPNVLLGTAADAGVGGVTYSFIAVPTASFTGANSTSAAAGTRFTSASTLAETVTAGEYTLLIEAKDLLGNVAYKSGPTFGVDLQAPTIAVLEGANSFADNSTNPAVTTLRLAVTDVGSGAEGVTGGIRGHSVFEFDADAGVEVRCYSVVGAFRGTISGGTGASPTNNFSCTNTTTSAPVATVGATEFYDVILPADENFYVVTVQSRDAAGNLSATTITRQTLVDVTAGPDAGTGLTAVTINTTANDNVNNTATITGVLRDNIEIDEYDARFAFTGLVARDGTDLPDEVPFTTPINVGDYGLPLVGEQTVSATTTVNVDNLAPDVGGAPNTVDVFGFGMRDVADNFAFLGSAPPAGAFNGFVGVTSFLLTANPAVIDRTPTGADPSSTTLTASAITAVGAASPFAQVFFYFVSPGADNLYGGADDHLVLIGSQSAAQAAVLTGETAREFRYSQTLSATAFPANVAGFQFRVLAIGVQTDGDAVQTDLINVTVNN